MFERNKGGRQSSPDESTPVTPEPPAASTITQSTSRGKAAMIGPTVKIQGEVTSEEDLVIEGQVEGSVTCNSNEVAIGNSGSLNANITAKTIRIDGAVEGDVTGHDKVIITRTGRVRGNIVAPAVTLEDGAKFKGSIDMDPSPQQSAVLPINSKSAAAKSEAAKDDESSGLKQSG